MFWTKK